jgi:hypothetical protein
LENEDDAQLLDPLASMAGREEEADTPSASGLPPSPPRLAEEDTRSFASHGGDRVLDPLLELPVEVQNNTRLRPPELSPRSTTPTST